MGKITNYTFKSEQSMKFLLCPIPPFLDNVDCSCGEMAIYITGDSKYKCKKCVIVNFPQNKLETNQDISSPITKKTIRDIKFEWSVSRDKWYTLWGRCIETNKWDLLLNKIKDIILNNKEIELDGEYYKERKRMVLTV